MVTIVGELLANNDGVHDGEDACAPEVNTLDCFVIFEQATDVWRFLQNAFGDVGGDERVDAAGVASCRDRRPERPSLRGIGRIRLRQEIDGLEWEIDAADEPAALAGSYAKLIGQNAFRHDSGVVAIEREFADEFSSEIPRPLDAACLADINRRITEGAVREDGDGEERGVDFQGSQEGAR